MGKIVWADTAVEDLDGIADYIALDKPEAARVLVRDVLTAVEALRKFPQMGSVPTELRGLPYRQLIVSPCRIFYRIESSVVYIVHVLRGEQLVRRDLFPSRRRESKSVLRRRTGRS
jgi:toxin ParE1/3/4